MFIYLKDHPDKRALVDEMCFGALSYLPNKYLNQRLLKHIYDRYDIYDNMIYSDAAAVNITTEKIGYALGLSYKGTPYGTRVVPKELNQEDKDIHKFFQGKTGVALQNLIKTTPVTSRLSAPRHSTDSVRLEAANCQTNQSWADCEH
ncbi:hypothetical protein PIB30_089322 [Stylosanthes scabra]|uniref:DNA-directed DNA polymerase n=1 Tax=Stylosanthes scabra TaxID=79078 RepID=A0ABU6QV34_9FABA|nr:hypothetical protein [Stylosanthes scabra]